MHEKAQALAGEASAASAVIVDARGVRKVYRTGAVDVEALRDVDLQIRRGEMAAVVGPSGCGKTTLLNCLSGLDEIDAGEVYVNGEEIHSMPDRRRTRFRGSQMGFVFQSFNLIPVFSAAENVELPLLLNDVPPREARGRTERVLAQVGLAERLDHKPAELSGGEQQRVTIARALATEPAIVWADEPTGNLDSATAGQVIELLHRLNRENGLSIVLVTHDERIAAGCSRIVSMQDGRITGDEVLS